MIAVGYALQPSVGAESVQAQQQTPLECIGIELCEPCAHLESLTQPGVIKGLVHRGGLNAAVVAGGTVAVGDEVTAL